ncbi:hypothetical protein FHT44_005150 [Mycolicibacterium sp. BK634]|uniref:hypothetical protein n=1 Tax=Mycolicibacterium sp. BK634 TaxID=2587099 RepID=UPI00160AD132|nr:hypothetical protein [Mycolicibacterium sp. BK634]MBB3752638.1 hypothetical protein [Mycolicibacterium sp. BK634]
MTTKETTVEQALTAALKSSGDHLWLFLADITDRFVQSATKWFAENGWALVKLPDPDDTGGGPEVDEYTAWWGHYPDNDPHKEARWPGQDIVVEGDEVSYGGNNYLPDEARAFAATFLAAAEIAERESKCTTT